MTDIEVKCSKCGRQQPVTEFFAYSGVATPAGTRVYRRAVDHCFTCRANHLVESNLIPEDMLAPEYDDGLQTWDYTAKYRRQYRELASMYHKQQQLPSSHQQRAFTNAVLRRVDAVYDDDRLLCLYTEVAPVVVRDSSAKLREWILEHGVCLDCRQPSPAMDFIERKRRGTKGYRYEFRVRCRSCAAAYMTPALEVRP